MSKNNTSENYISETEQLTDAAYYIMLSLLTERHGYAIMQYLEQKTDGAVRMGPATLYTQLKKLRASGMIQQVEVTERKKDYQLTEEGFTILKKEIQRRKKMAQLGIEALEDYERRNLK